MTPEALIKLSEITGEDDLTWRSESYDTGHPKCLCSACGERVKDIEEFEDPESEEATAHFPIRFWQIRNGKADQEAVIHLSCFEYLSQKNIIQLSP